MTDRVAYLEAKRTLDDRALNGAVLSAAFDPLPAAPVVLEVGAGTATMAERLYDWGVVRAGEWIAVDSHAPSLDRGRSRLLARPDAVAIEDGVALGDLSIRLVEADAFEYASGRSIDHPEAPGTAVDGQAPPADLLVGCAFFDLVDADRLSTFEAVASRLYAPITYDGTTAFEPGDPDDSAVLAAYHAHMAVFRPGSATGARALSDVLSTVECTGPSPWVVEPPYEPGEARVVDHLLGTIESAVATVGEDASAWVGRRRAQLAASELRYRAENVDVLGRL